MTQLAQPKCNPDPILKLIIRILKYSILKPVSADVVLTLLHNNGHSIMDSNTFDYSIGDRKTS